MQNVSYFPLPQTSTSLSHTIYGPSSLDPDQRPEFGTYIEWNYNADLLAVGSPHYGATDEGAIFVYNANQELVWSLLGSAKERIGGRISISNNYIAVGRRSAIEIYDTNTGDVISQVLGTMPGNDVNFVKNNLIIVGEDPFGTRQGQARIFTANGLNWTAQTVSGLMLPEGRFGWVVAASNDGARIAISAPNASPDFSKQGYVQVLERNVDGGWEQLGDILFGVEENGQFGFSLAMSGDGNTVVVGAPGTTDGGVTVFRFDNTGWQQIGATLIAKETGTRFGRSVAVSHYGQRIAATSFFFDGFRGHARVFDFINDGWVAQHDVEGTDDQGRLGWGNFGLALSRGGSVLTVGAVWADTENGELTGLVEIVDLEGSDGSILLPTTSPGASPTISPSSITMAPIIHHSFDPAGDVGSPNTGPSLITKAPTMSPSRMSSTAPSRSPSLLASSWPSASPSIQPIRSPSEAPSNSPSNAPSIDPTDGLTASPTEPTEDQRPDPVTVARIDGDDESSAPSLAVSTMLGAVIVIHMI